MLQVVRLYGGQAREQARIGPLRSSAGLKEEEDKLTESTRLCEPKTLEAGFAGFGDLAPARRRSSIASWRAVPTDWRMSPLHPFGLTLDGLQRRLDAACGVERTKSPFTAIPLRKLVKDSPAGCADPLITSAWGQTLHHYAARAPAPREATLRGHGTLLERLPSGKTQARPLPSAARIVL